MGSKHFIWTPMRDAHLRRLREDGCTLSEMARELRTSQEIIRRQVGVQEAEEREMEPMVSGPSAPIHPNWFSERGA
jgi:hypothetical protein